MTCFCSGSEHGILYSRQVRGVRLASSPAVATVAMVGQVRLLMSLLIVHDERKAFDVVVNYARRLQNVWSGVVLAMLMLDFTIVLGVIHHVSGLCGDQLTAGA